jgi:hypothetical protein
LPPPPAGLAKAAAAAGTLPTNLFARSDIIVLPVNSAVRTADPLSARAADGMPAATPAYLADWVVPLTDSDANPETDVLATLLAVNDTLAAGPCRPPRGHAKTP